MPNCFCLTRKSDLSAGPVALNKIDEEMCARFNEPVHEVNYHAMWYDIIGFQLACGKSFCDVISGFIKAICEKSKHADYYLHLIDVALWLEENFTSDSWVEVGKR